MAKRALDAKTREDYHIEFLADADDSGDVPPDDVEAWVRQTAERFVEQENEKIWAFYNDPETDLTQLEARDRAQTFDYPGRYQVSQSSVSRKLSQLDDAMITEAVRLLNMEERSHEDEAVGLVGRDTLRQLQDHMFAEAVEAYRETLARFLVDLEALGRFRDGERETPAWARERFPELDPDLGRDLYLDAGYGADVHDPTTE